MVENHFAVISMLRCGDTKNFTGAWCTEQESDGRSTWLLAGYSILPASINWSPTDTRLSRMANYIIYFNQQWVGDHSEEWFTSRGPLARVVVDEMREAGIVLFAGGLVEEIELAFGSDENGKLGGPITTSGEFLGGLTIIDVDTDEEAKMWGAKVGEACGWPQEIRKFKGNFTK